MRASRRRSTTTWPGSAACWRSPYCPPWPALPAAYLDPDALAAGFRTAVLISGALCAAGGLLAAVTITNPARERRDVAISEPCLHCGLDAPPLAASTNRRILAIQPRG